MVTKRRQFQLLESQNDDVLAGAIDSFLILVRHFEPRQTSELVRRLLCIGYYKSPQLLENPELVQSRIGPNRIGEFRFKMSLSDPVEADLETVFSQIKRDQINALFTDLVMIGYRAMYLDHPRLQQNKAHSKTNISNVDNSTEREPT